MDLRRLIRSSTLLYAAAAPLLYVTATMIAIQLAAHPTGLHPWYETPWNDGLLAQLDREIASARGFTLGIAFTLAFEAALLAALGDRLNRRSTIGGLVLCAATGMVYLMSLALAGLATYAIVLYPSGDVDLGLLFPGWYFPALVVIGVTTVAALVTWLTVAVRDASAAQRSTL
ncbi:hypothetical protein GCM10010156_60280 [Planobispora rosea]|uniref:Uncharacterized protein n=1 Tax=Planobispora rosea TaxID=35762 RepID=A0A8J3WFJ2_PLARO|nr:hypothetical protein [Planobispora rosea]GGS93974.1 hypothetical protein GCM10010156_60280 [Planobispora rosea]GIH87378.1 hypothetical protein Pro02_57860 [Planobispora rosea]